MSPFFINQILKSWNDVNYSIEQLKKLKIPPHPDLVKSWDTWKIIDFIEKNGKKQSNILDVGCNGSPILPSLKKLGYQNLFGCDVDLKIRKRRFLRRVKNRLTSSDPDALIHGMLENKNSEYLLSIQDLEKLDYESEKFDFVTSLSVIEHGVNLENYFKEMNRVLKNGGFLLTSTDYWPEKISTESNVYGRPNGDVIFDKDEIISMLKTAERLGLKLIEPMNYEFKDRVVTWKKTGKKYTFAFFILEKVPNLQN